MTREEAIRVLEAEKKFLFHGSLSDKHYEPAFDMAIEALQREEAEANGHCHRIRPSNVEVVVRCKDCRYFKKIAERSDSGLCHRDIVASAWKENGYCSRGKRKGGDDE